MSVGVLAFGFILSSLPFSPSVQCNFSWALRWGQLPVWSVVVEVNRPLLQSRPKAQSSHGLKLLMGVSFLFFFCCF